MKPAEVIQKAYQHGVVVPAFNIPNLNMVEPIIKAVVDENSVAMIQVARLEWEKMEAKSVEDVAKTYFKYANTSHVMLHLDHIPVIDEDMLAVDYLELLKRAIGAGYQSVMVDGSRLSLSLNIETTNRAVAVAHQAGVPCEAELGSVMGHEGGEMPPYEEVFTKKIGFTEVEELKTFVKETECDWVSVAVGNFHGAIAESNRFAQKPEARLDVDYIRVLKEASGIPLVLHGGSGIKRDYIQAGIQNGIAKINVGSGLRRAYQVAYETTQNVSAAQSSLYSATREYIRSELGMSGTKAIVG